MGDPDHLALGPQSRLFLHLASSCITSAGSVHKSRGDSVVHMWVQLKRRRFVCSDLDKGATSDAGKYPFGASNVGGAGRSFC